MRAVVALVFVVGTAHAQPARGDELIVKYKLEPLRSLAGEIAALGTALGETDPLTPAHFAKLAELRGQHPILLRVASLEDAELVDVATALCRGPDPACTTRTLRALQCLADRCAVAIPEPQPEVADLLDVPEECRTAISKARKTPARFGIGMDASTGYQHSRHPHDGAGWSLGMEARMRTSARTGLVVRLDRVAGRDEAVDENDNGNDDMSTGSITRIVALAGPSLVLQRSLFEDETRSWRLDLLGGYMATRSQADESGPAAGADLAFQLWNVRFGFRYVQGFGDAREARMLLAHFGFLVGSDPLATTARDARKGTGCTNTADDEQTDHTRLALGFDWLLGGYGFDEHLGYLGTGFAIEAKYHLTQAFDLLARTDVALYPGDERDRTLHQAVLGGLRIDHSKRRRDTGFFTTVMGGYSHGASITPSTSGTGPIADLSIGWGAQENEGGGYLRLHGRFGVASDNVDYRAVFLSAGFEIRFDPGRW